MVTHKTRWQFLDARSRRDDEQTERSNTHLTSEAAALGREGYSLTSFSPTSDSALLDIAFPASHTDGS